MKQIKKINRIFGKLDKILREIFQNIRTKLDGNSGVTNEILKEFRESKINVERFKNRLYRKSFVKATKNYIAEFIGYLGNFDEIFAAFLYFGKI